MQKKSIDLNFLNIVFFCITTVFKMKFIVLLPFSVFIETNCVRVKEKFKSLVKYQKKNLIDH